MKYQTLVTPSCVWTQWYPFRNIKHAHISAQTLTTTSLIGSNLSLVTTAQSRRVFSTASSRRPSVAVGIRSHPRRGVGPRRWTARDQTPRPPSIDLTCWSIRTR